MNRLKDDLDHILKHTEGLWEELRGKRIFITGGTGFFGCWLLESFAWANEELNLGASALVLSRNPEAFEHKAPHLFHNPAIGFLKGDVRSFDYPAGEFSHIIHAVTDSSAKLNGGDPLLMLDTHISGTRRVLDFALNCEAAKFLLTSSGAVYGNQPPEMTQISEDYMGGPDVMNPESAYAEGKRVAELLCAIYSTKHNLDTKIARCFVFTGPYRPINISYAIGDFISDALNGKPIVVKGDGTQYRSYLYASDLMIWLWTILFRGECCRPYNVGSDSQISIRDLAALVANTIDPKLDVIISKESIAGQQPERYIPSIQRSSTELDLRILVEQVEAILRTAYWETTKLEGESVYRDKTQTNLPGGYKQVTPVQKALK